MNEETITVTRESVVEETGKAKAEGYRFLTMSCVDLDEDNVDLLYHFDRDLTLKHFRMVVPKRESVPSVSGVYLAAFLIENEIKDHFGIEFDGLALDFGGTLYLDEEVTRTPFCKYGVVRKDSGGEAAASAPAEDKPAAEAPAKTASKASAGTAKEPAAKSEAASEPKPKAENTAEAETKSGTAAEETN